MDKEIKNPKTGNKIKVRTALQLPDEHPANKKAKDMVAKTPTGDKSKKKKGFFSKLSKLNPFSKKDDKKDDEPKEKEKGPFGTFLGTDTVTGKKAKETHDRLGEFMDTYGSQMPEEYMITLKELQKKAYDIGADIDEAGKAYKHHQQKQRVLDAEAQEVMDDIEQKGMDGTLDDTPTHSMFDDDSISFADKIEKAKKSKKKDDDSFSFADAMAKAKKESVKESKKRRYTVKEVRTWMKKLEENRYKKVYNSDARRVAWMVNNEGVELSEMPKSMSKKWTKAQYGRERYLATEFLKSKSEQMNESMEAAHALMNKKIKNAKTGNMITIRSAVQLPDGHPTKKKARRILNKAFHGEGKLSEAISGADRKILFILVREIVRGLKSKIKNFDVNNKSHMNRVGSSILSIIRAMTYSPDNVNYKNFKKYFPKNFNSKLIQKKLKQFHSQNDKVQVTLVTQAIKNELGEGVKEGKLSEGKFAELYMKNDMKTKVKVSKIIKKMKLKIDKDYDVKALDSKGKMQKFMILPKHRNDFLDALIQNNIKVRG